MLYLHSKPKRKSSKPTRKGGHNNHKRVRVTKEAWESACSELFKNAFTIDYNAVKNASQNLGISPTTFEKYFHLWIANGRQTENLAIIAKNEVNENDQSGDQAEVERVQSLPQIKRSYKRTV